MDPNNPQGSGGANPQSPVDPGGDNPGNDPKPNPGSDPVDTKPGDGDKPPKPSGDTVSYDTHRKLLSEKKKLQERLDEIEKEKKQRELEDLEKQENYKKIAELKAKEAEDSKTELMQIKSDLQNSKKLSAVLDVLGPIDKKYWDLIDISQVVVNPETGQIDEMSVTKYAEGWKKQYFEIIQPGNKSNMPSDHPSPGSGLTYDEWLTLPAKEKEERMHEVIS